MRERTLGEIAGHIAAAPLPSAQARVLAGPDVVIDSREATEGAVFVALPGERADGHDFAAQAAEGGAVAAICARPVEGLVPLLVPNTQEALAALARAVVAEARGRGLVTVALTGSSGKTSTKDLAAQVLAAAGETVSPPGSFNNEIGVPLTALRVSESTRFLVSEMGARGQGHIEWLCSIVPPRIAAVLNVGHAHVGEFGSVAAIARAKGEIVEALDGGGWAVLNADDALVTAMASRTRARIARFSTKGDPGEAALRVWASAIEPDELQRHAFTLNAAGQTEGWARVELQSPGAHQVANALAAAAIGLAAGMDVAGVAAALSAAVQQSRWRMELIERGDGVLVVNDAYNANPDSMAAALDTAAKLRRPDGTVLAVLGDMLELGEAGPEAHREVGRRAAALGIDLIGVGALGAEIVAAASQAGGWAVHAADADEAELLAGQRVRPGDVILVKASRSLALDRVAQRLIDADAPGRAS